MRIYFSILVLFLAFQGFSQEISGRAYYTSIFKGEKPTLTQKQMENPQMRDLAEQMQQAITDEFVLEFTHEESIFKMLPKLEKPDPQPGKISLRRTIMGDDEILYKNLQKSEYLNSKELYGKKFLIRDDIEIPDWQLSKESKTIGDYVCFKATYVPKSQESDDNWMKKKDKKEIIAWYTPQIPVRNGPKEYGGLPGLILEVQDGNLKFLCTKIVLNPEEVVIITKPKKGKKVTQKEFDAILKEKSKDMMENFKTQKRRN